MQQILEQAWETLSSGWDQGIGFGGTAATVLGAIWAFFRVIRTVVGTLFILCVVYLVLRICFDIDISTWLLPLFQNIAA